ncbi:HEAT repeat protein [Dictyocaulus viviparus]|uniref:HEAT repeat protein n=1 Tax=Dictyocaulus viviparus TaxID=29172 RepID=A0A0D8XWE8_DICVI|nr:HEAT repeat protein [Dictyocaulus viviparus]
MLSNECGVRDIIRHPSILPSYLLSYIFSTETSSLLLCVNKLVEGFDQCCCPHCVIPTSSTLYSQDVFFDTRIRYGHIIMSVFNKISKELAEQEDFSNDTMVSLNHISLLSSAFQFFILTCISPYLDKGVGVPLHIRSHIISFIGLVSALLLSSLPLAVSGSELLRKYCSDIICVFEQLRFFGLIDMFPQYEEILATVSPQLLVCNLLALVKSRGAAETPPTWFTISVGSRLSAILMGKNGLDITLSAYEEISNGQFWDNTPLLSDLGKQMALPPRNVKKTAYYKNITSQFLGLVNSGKICREKVVVLFSLFAEQLKRKNAFAHETMIEDVLFKPWEIIASTKNWNWSPSHATSLCLLKMWSESNLSSQLLKDCPRFLPAAVILLSMLPVSSNDVCPLRSLRTDILAIIKFALRHLENLASIGVLISFNADFLFAFITSSSPCFELSQEKNFVEIIGEASPIYGKVILSAFNKSRDEVLGRKIEITIILIKEFDQFATSRLLIEIACKSVQMWDSDTEVYDFPRFIDYSGSEINDIVDQRSISHFVAGVFFEQLQERDIDPTSAEITVSLVHLIQVLLFLIVFILLIKISPYILKFEAVLKSTMGHLNERYEKKSLDVIAGEDERDRQLHSLISQNAKMAIGLAGAVIMTAKLDDKTNSALSNLRCSLSSFALHIDHLKCDEETFVTMANDARELISVFGEVVPAKNPVDLLRKKPESCIDLVDSLREGLLSDSPVNRGGALLKIGQLIRARHTVILSELDRWLFKTMKDLILDPDSYVYLAAINSLAEAACYGSTYLRDLITLFKNFSSSQQLEEKVDSIMQGSHDESNISNTVSTSVVLRSRLCEVLGKVFRVLGDMSPVWMDESAGVFLSCFKDNDEIIKASALSSLAELIVACRGRNLEKYIDEILFAMDSFLTTDTSFLVRRATVHLIRQVIKSCDTGLIEIIGGRMRNLQRELLRLWRWDHDHVVRLHAELALDEIRAAVRSVVIQETSTPSRKVFSLYMSKKVDVAAIAASVQEFYTTSNPEKRRQLNDDLCMFKIKFSCEDTVAACILLMGSRYPANVQYFAAVSLYETIRHRYEECVANITLMELLKSFLIESLTSNAHVQMQSITNKLSSTLAILCLYCMPDVWSDPVATLTNIWAAQPELLLRVLAEIAAEFSNIQMPLTQRSKLKTELHKTSEDIIRIIATVMGADDASPSTRQAAVECVEQWVKLPGIGLHQWSSVLSVVFGAVSEDSAALTNLFNILAANDELTSIDQLVHDISHFIATVVAQKITTDLEGDILSEDVVSLISAVCSIAVVSIPTLLRDPKNNLALFGDICSLFTRICSCQGVYAMDELISDLPSSFFMTLREHIGTASSASKQDEIRNIATAVGSYYAEVCRSAIDKLSFPVSSRFDEYDKLQKEQFIRYRMVRSEVSIDAYFIMGGDTLKFLNMELEASIVKGDLCRTECIMFLWETVADYLSEADYTEICNNLNLCTQLSHIGEGVDEDRLANTTMRHLHALSHLIQEHDDAVHLEEHVVRLILPFVPRKSVSKEALRTLAKFVSERSNGVMLVGNEISQVCYTFFMDDSNIHALRLEALKCIGYILSMKRSCDIMDILNKIMAPYMRSMGTVTSFISAGTVENKMFQISIFSCLFATLSRKEGSDISPTDSPNTLIFCQVFPLFQQILTFQGPIRALGDKVIHHRFRKIAAISKFSYNQVCDAVRSAVSSFPAEYLPQMFPLVSIFLSDALLSNPVAACSLAKTVVLVFGNCAKTASELCSSLRQWLETFVHNISYQAIEEWLSLIYQIMKKNYKTLRANEEPSLSIISNAIVLAGQTLGQCDQPCVVRLASQVLAVIANQSTSYGDQGPRLLLANHGPALVKDVFNRIQVELIRATVESLAEVLFFFMKEFSAETRRVLDELDHGDSPIVAAMFREIGNLRNFKQMTLRLNMASRKGACSQLR